MNPLDLIVCAFLTICLIRGFFRGLVKEVASVVGIVGGLYAAYTYYPLLAKSLSKWIPNPSHHNLVGFFILFGAVAIIIGILGEIIKHLLRITSMGWIDRTCGAGIGMVKGVFLVTIVFLIVGAFLPPGNGVMRQSRLSPYMNQLSGIMARFIPQELQPANVKKVNGINRLGAYDGRQN